MNKTLRKASIISLLLVGNFINLFAQRGYYDAPYKRYEADLGTLSSGAFVMPRSYSQPDLQSEASGQVCVDMTTANASVEWTIIEAADGLVMRYCIPKGETAVVGVYVDNVRITGITLTSTWSWESLWNNGNPNNNGVSNKNPKKRFDEIRYKLPNKIPVASKLKLVTESGNIHLDFVELEPVPEAITAPSGAAVYSGDGSTLQTFITNNGGKTIFLPTGDYNVSVQLQFNNTNTKLQGAGMWYSHINFTSGTTNKGGLCANVANVSYADLFLTTNNASRSNSYKAINGVYTSGSTITNVWAEHFECGAWIGNYLSTGPAYADGFLVSNCRFRDNYADGINLCKGTSNTIVEHCSFRNNGDDDMAIWSANNQECINNTFRYNTSENTWRASGAAIYGGKNNQAYNLLIKDNLEAGLRANNAFSGYQFDASGQHVFHDITVIGCGTFNDLYNNPVGAIDLYCTNICGTQVKNIKFYNIDVIDSRNDGIYFNKSTGDGFYNFIFENITIANTGKEYPYNNQNNSTAKRGMFVRFAGSPGGNGTYCGMNYSGRGGNAVVDEDKSGIGAFSWTASTGCSQITSFTPTNAITGSVITINGSNFTGATSVSFGGVAASSFTVVSNSVINAIVGNGSFGTVSVTNSTGTIVTKSGFNYMLCPGTISSSIGSDVSGSSYQWQVNAGGDFVNVADGANYAGSQSSVLLLNNISSSWYGYQYRCLINGGIYASNTFTLKFTDTWTGAGGTTAWENGANWSCGVVPDANTDVIINSGGAILNSNTSARSISVSDSAIFIVTAGNKLSLL
ncbi:right-handed parallel beta-helix repeat-containing protein [Ferruginibacter albus]|uniref:right-handed parallel beta-helix repeat-containing protein n=1 Tax=Ferruginibacter albus TaxID=2875540 RepID=UPI001CC7C017|nr:right-handed parallel beta-helix repeat-containing protein [Ferruginibacter albus]UAY52065.1 right-handed parallel beta-helix repeat-containing protein [Ferruginibacter albus]